MFLLSFRFFTKIVLSSSTVVIAHAEIASIFLADLSCTSLLSKIPEIRIWDNVGHAKG